MTGAVTPARLEQGMLSTAVVRAPSPQKAKSQQDFEMGHNQLCRVKEICQLQYQVGKQKS